MCVPICSIFELNVMIISRFLSYTCLERAQLYELLLRTYYIRKALVHLDFQWLALYELKLSCDTISKIVVCIWMMLDQQDSNQPI